jgi:hypothetical protein
VFLFCWLIFRQWQAHKFYLICFHSKKSLKRQCTRCLRLKSIAPIPLNPLSILFRHIQPIWLVAMPDRLTLDSTHILEPSYINIYGYGSIPINTIFSGLNIPFTSYFDVHKGYKVLTHCHINYLNPSRSILNPQLKNPFPLGIPPCRNPAGRIDLEKKKRRHKPYKDPVVPYLLFGSATGLEFRAWSSFLRKCLDPCGLYPVSFSRRGPSLKQDVNHINYIYI